MIKKMEKQECARAADLSGRDMKVGIYVFTDAVKSRKTKKREEFFDGSNYVGLRYIAKEAAEIADVTRVSKETIDTVDFVLISITSYYDILNIIHELYGKKIEATVVVGGAGLSNPEILSGIADIAVVGRGEGIIKKILLGERVPGVWYGPGSKVKILPASKFIDIEDKIMGSYSEVSVGCKQKCFFLSVLMEK